MRKDWAHWSIYLNPSSFSNWGIGFNYYREYNTFPFEMLARVCQFDLLLFNITITRWENPQWR